MTQQLVDLSHRTIAFVTQPSSTFLRLCVWAMSSVCIKTPDSSRSQPDPPAGQLLSGTGGLRCECLCLCDSLSLPSMSSMCWSAVGYTVPNDVSVIALGR